MLIRNSLRYTSGAPAYPAGIVANGLQSVWNYQSGVGIGLNDPAATFKTPTANATEFASLGGSIQGTPGTLGYRVELTGSSTWTNWDFTGFIVCIEGANPAPVFNNVKFNPGNRYAAIFCDFNGNGYKGAVTLNDCSIDCSGISDTTFEGPLYMKGHNLSANRVLFRGSKFPTYVSAIGSSLGAQTISITDAYFKELGAATIVEAHLEYIHARTALGNITLALTRTFIDGRLGKQGGLGSMTGLVNPEQWSGSGKDITTTITDSILIGALEMGSNWNIQTSADTGRTNSLTANNSVLEPGSSGVFAKSGDATYFGSGNKKLDGTAIVLP